MNIRDKQVVDKKVNFHSYSKDGKYMVDIEGEDSQFELIVTKPFLTDKLNLDHTGDLSVSLLTSSDTRFFPTFDSISIIRLGVNIELEWDWATGERKEFSLIQPQYYTWADEADYKSLTSRTFIFEGSTKVFILRVDYTGNNLRVQPHNEKLTQERVSKVVHKNSIYYAVDRRIDRDEEFTYVDIDSPLAITTMGRGDIGHPLDLGDMFDLVLTVENERLIENKIITPHTRFIVLNEGLVLAKKDSEYYKFDVSTLPSRAHLVSYLKQTPLASLKPCSKEDIDMQLTLSSAKMLMADYTVYGKNINVELKLH